MRRTTVLLVFLVAAACSSGRPSPTPTTTASPAATSAKINPRDVNVDALLRPGAIVKEKLFADMDGDGTDEIAVFSQAQTTSAGSPIPQSYVDVYSVASGTPANVFDASTSGAVANEPGTVDQEVTYMNFVSFAGKPDLVLGVETIGAGSGPLDVWVWSWGTPFKQEFRYSTTVDGTVIANGKQLKLDTGYYKPTDPLCCPSGMSHLTIGVKDGQIGIVSETTTKS